MGNILTLFEIAELSWLIVITAWDAKHGIYRAFDSNKNLLRYYPLSNYYLLHEDEDAA